MSSMKQTILKVQRSLVTTATEPQVLMYDKLRLVTYQGPLSKLDGLAELIGDSAKIFVEANIVLGEVIGPDGKRQVTADLTYGKILPDQGW